MSRSERGSGPAGGARRFVEPARALPLRWGSYTPRLIGGLALIVAGGIAIAGSNTFQLLLLLAGSTAHIVGWGVIPSDGWRRVVAALPSTLGCWMALPGPKYLAVLVLPFVAWLLVRHRPALAWLTVPVVIAAAIGVALAVDGFDRALPGAYPWMLPASAVMGAVLIGCAFLARLIHAAVDRSRRNGMQGMPSRRATGDL
ncbi:hypothetical protein GCM10027515_16090 [Schumannella luteola]|uniref:Uncharacterized protein n=1 Tax=Schumannella luteola TaxID=472059 RepID=A0A852YHH2_9MICO|nr:hypothetical protein [Schumannella luteola]NYH00592.1 hypothetical protein [Schumannella luteola]TPX04948.1 hypothetical protein FJ656_09230 [Schumannella luteola]